MAKCGTCGTTTFGGISSKGQTFCSESCERQYKSTVTCGKCGTENPLDGQKCKECDDYLHQYKTAQGTTPKPAQAKPKNVSPFAGLMTIFGGLFTMGVIYNVLSSGILGTYNQGKTNSIINQALDKTFRIDVEGDKGLKFQGNYGCVQNDGKSSQQSVEGVTPASYSCNGMAAVAVFSKASQGSETIKVDIVVNGNVVNSGSSSAPFGGVNVSGK